MTIELESEDKEMMREFADAVNDNPARKLEQKRNLMYKYKSLLHTALDKTNKNSLDRYKYSNEIPSDGTPNLHQNIKSVYDCADECTSNSECNMFSFDVLNKQNKCQTYNKSNSSNMETPPPGVQIFSVKPMDASDKVISGSDFVSQEKFEDLYQSVMENKRMLTKLGADGKYTIEKAIDTNLDPNVPPPMPFDGPNGLRPDMDQELSGPADSSGSSPELLGDPPQRPDGPRQRPGEPLDLLGDPPQLLGDPPQLPGGLPQLPGGPPVINGGPPVSGGGPDLL